MVAGAGAGAGDDGAGAGADDDELTADDAGAADAMAADGASVIPCGAKKHQSPVIIRFCGACNAPPF